MAVKLGRYRLESKIADGGMASVWRGFDEDLHRTVAVKVMRDVIQADAVFAERFVRELRSSQHPLGLRLRVEPRGLPRPSTDRGRKPEGPAGEADPAGAGGGL